MKLITKSLKVIRRIIFPPLELHFDLNLSDKNPLRAIKEGLAENGALTISEEMLLEGFVCKIKDIFGGNLDSKIKIQVFPDDRSQMVVEFVSATKKLFFFLIIVALVIFVGGCPSIDYMCFIFFFCAMSFVWNVTYWSEVVLLYRKDFQLKLKAMRID